MSFGGRLWIALKSWNTSCPGTSFKEAVVQKLREIPLTLFCDTSMPCNGLRFRFSVIKLNCRNNLKCYLDCYSIEYPINYKNLE